MEDETSSTTTTTTITSPNSTQQLAIEGQKHLQQTIQSAFHILSSLNDELCSSNLWSSSSSSSSPHHAHAPLNGDVTSSDATHQFEIGAGALDEARLRYRTSVAALRSVLTAIPNSKKLMKAKDYDVDEDSIDELDVEKMEEHAAGLRKELEVKNLHLKNLIDQFRELIADVSTWQSSVAG